MTRIPDDFRVMTSGAFTAAHLALVPRIEALTGKRVITVTTSIGTGETSIPNRLKRREPVDIVIVADSVQRQFIDEGYVLADSPVLVASSSIGIAVRAGAPKPDLSSAEALRRVLLQAKCIAYSASVSGKYLTTEIYQKLGIADQCLQKSRLIGGGERTGSVVARGEADIAVQQISELMPVPGIAHITPLPPELQRVSVFSAGVAVWSSDVALARSVIRFLASAEAVGAIERSGLESVSASA
ncbi:MAG: ABC transporter substrate-binding protein [Betaproteobacteria bacterium]|nr:ABC transporter substrate-binding protein [Betaproteobacteria bacterium]